MFVGLKGHWKTPIGYIFCNRIKVFNLTCFIKKTLDMSFSYNINVRNITFDGASTKFNFVLPLGAQFGKESNDIKPNFLYGDFDHPIHVIPEPC